LKVRFNISELQTTRAITEIDKKLTASTDRTNRSVTPTRSTTVDYKRLDNLYQNGVNKKKRFEMMDKLKKDEDMKKEIEACTFKPKVNTYYRPRMGNMLHDIPIYERHALWHNKKVDK
jgi:hypothetical protein